MKHNLQHLISITSLILIFSSCSQLELTHFHIEQSSWDKVTIVADYNMDGNNIYPDREVIKIKDSKNNIIATSTGDETLNFDDVKLDSAELITISVCGYVNGKGSACKDTTLYASPKKLSCSIEDIEYPNYAAGKEYRFLNMTQNCMISREVFGSANKYEAIKESQKTTGNICVSINSTKIILPFQKDGSYDLNKALNFHNFKHNLKKIIAQNNNAKATIKILLNVNGMTCSDSRIVKIYPYIYELKNNKNQRITLLEQEASFFKFFVKEKSTQEFINSCTNSNALGKNYIPDRGLDYLAVFTLKNQHRKNINFELYKSHNFTDTISVKNITTSKSLSKYWQEGWVYVKIINNDTNNARFDLVSHQVDIADISCNAFYSAVKNVALVKTVKVISDYIFYKDSESDGVSENNIARIITIAEGVQKNKSFDEMIKDGTINEIKITLTKVIPNSFLVEGGYSFTEELIKEMYKHY